MSIKNVTLLNHIYCDYQSYIETDKYIFKTVKKSLCGITMSKMNENISNGGIVPSPKACGLLSQSSPSG